MKIKWQKIIAFCKISYNRCSGLMAMLLIGLVFAKQYNIPMRWLPLVYLVIFGVMLLAGWVDYKCGFHSAEIKMMHERNPILMDIYNEMLNKCNNCRERGNIDVCMFCGHRDELKDNFKVKEKEG